MSIDNRPDAGLDEAARLDLPLYTYFTIPNSMRGLIPKWLWEKKMVNSNTRNKAKSSEPIQLFEGQVVDLYTLADDLTKAGYAPCYIHHQNRDNGTIRIRVNWEKGKEQLPEEQVIWILRTLMRRFCWNVKSFRNPEATEHLPPHINISSGEPVEKSEATCVWSIQLLKRAFLALINDPDETQNVSNRAHRTAKAST